MSKIIRRIRLKLKIRRQIKELAELIGDRTIYLVVDEEKREARE